MSRPLSRTELSVSDYWLTLIRDHTDAAILPQDVGIFKDAVPKWWELVKAGTVKLVKTQLVITKLGRSYLNGNQ